MVLEIREALSVYGEQLEALGAQTPAVPFPKCLQRPLIMAKDQSGHCVPCSAMPHKCLPLGFAPITRRQLSLAIQIEHAEVAHRYLRLLGSGSLHVELKRMRRWQGAGQRTSTRILPPSRFQVPLTVHLTVTAANMHQMLTNSHKRGKLLLTVHHSRLPRSRKMIRGHTVSQQTFMKHSSHARHSTGDAPAGKAHTTLA